MNRLMFLLPGLLLTLPACSSLTKINDEVKNIAYHIKTLKEKGCNAVPKPALRVLVILIKSRIENYPANGVCDKDWVRDVLIHHIDLLERDDAIQKGTEQLGYKADSGHTVMDQPSAAILLLPTHSPTNYRTRKLPDRSSLYTQKIPLVYASIFLRNKSRSRNTRLHLYRFIQNNHQKAGRSGIA